MRVRTGRFTNRELRRPSGVALRSHPKRADTDQTLFLQPLIRHPGLCGQRSRHGMGSDVKLALQSAFSVAPFFGAVLAVIVLGEPLTADAIESDCEAMNSHIWLSH
jgi:hypothetical protein